MPATVPFHFNANMDYILEDTRNQINKHKNIHAFCDSHGIQILRTKLYVGDYTLPTKQDICVDTKKDMVEVCQNIYQGHDRFVRELKKADECGIKLIVLVEDDSVKDMDDVINWQNPHPNKSALTPNGDRCYKVMKTISYKYGCIWRFCNKKETGEVLWSILNS